MVTFFSEGDNDFKLEEFLAGTPETFEPHYGENNILYRSYLLWTPLNVLSLEQLCYHKKNVTSRCRKILKGNV